MASWPLSPPGGNTNNNAAAANNGQNSHNNYHMAPPPLYNNNNNNMLPPLYGLGNGRSPHQPGWPIPLPPPPGTRLPLIMSPIFQTPPSSYLPPTPSYAPGDVVGGPLPSLSTLDYRGPALAPMVTPGNSPPPSVRADSPPAVAASATPAASAAPAASSITPTSTRSAAPSATPSSAGSAPSATPSSAGSAPSAAPSATPSATPSAARSTRSAAPSATPSAAPSAAAAPSASTTTKSTAAAASKKRKSTDSSTNVDLFPTDVEFIDWGDDRLALGPSDTCNSVRRKINNWISSGAMKVGEFQRAIHVSAKGYGNFMNRSGTWDGENCDAFHQAHRFFKMRELQGLPIKAPKPKKAKTAADGSGAATSGKAALDALYDVSMISLPGEDSRAVPVYDTCDEVRRKIKVFLAKDGVTQAAFAREISKTFADGTTVSPANLRYFSTRHGRLDGNTNVSFYAAYVFFEKQRVKASKPKTKFREEMEVQHGADGVDVENSSNAHVFCLAGDAPYIDKYGKLRV